MKPFDEFTAAILDMLAPLGPIESGRFFGGYGLKFAGVQFAMIFKGTLYLRVDEALAAELAKLGAQPFEYRTARRQMVVGSYYAVPADGIDDADRLVEWGRRSIAAALIRASSL